MNNLTTSNGQILPMSQAGIDVVRRVETLAKKEVQVPIITDHQIHAGVYTRTVSIPAGVLITGALIKRATNLIISGKVIVYIGENETLELEGYHILAASAHRKQAFFACKDTWLTMFFATEAKSIEEAELEFTDEVELLASRDGKNINNITITGE